MPPLQPVYTIDDAEQAIRRLSPVPYHQTFQVGPATGVFYDAGHILGSAVTVLAVEGRTIVFSGDLGRTAAPIIRDPESPPAAADLLIMEATYGDRRHEPFERGERKLADVVRSTARPAAPFLFRRLPSAARRTSPIRCTASRTGGRFPRSRRLSIAPWRRTPRPSSGSTRRCSTPKRLHASAPAIPFAAATSGTCVRWRSPRNSTPG